MIELYLVTAVLRNLPLSVEILTVCGRHDETEDRLCPF